MKFTVLTLFPEITGAYFASSIMAKAVERGLVEYQAVQIRDYATDRHRSCDDAPYGGGPGMLMFCEPLGRAFEAVGVSRRDVVVGDKTERQSRERLVVYLSPSGELFNQKTAEEFAGEKELVLLCGRYEGVDQRVLDLYVDREISVGDYVLSSGEVAALSVIDAVYRLIDGVITGESLDEESFIGGLLEYPQWTRPPEYGTLTVPPVLLSGHHEQIRKWRLKKRIEKTMQVRPELLAKILAEIPAGHGPGGDAAGRETKEIKEIIEIVREVQHERDKNA
ncbi:MAG: tRNA (guanosine(37)-N1)-methyltransferase TrmD [Spirochaetaceae bacterium]|jgi:tRNA (guanine37-N1)-methyltransferase|nr:tRNA (guanosine(37)-N1)-methyltransferase TrmD [Spirochaetaceae bacterium]